MKHTMTATLSLLAVLLTANVSPAAKCADEDPDGARVAAARAQVQSQCVCNEATDHGAYVECASGVAKERSALDASDPNHLPKSCKGAVTKCAAKSTCGKPGFVTCCRQKADGSTKCSTKKSAENCTDKGGTVGTCASCCDACSSPPAGPSCPAPPTTTTLLPVPTTLPDGVTGLLE
ncbi:MAG TPA: hypothetical protein VEC57_16955 [Candidatus Limnocylindrales bacterium]|nr:hypothetical protein [Candidatus Limnocylindrales bacterium]